MHLTPQGITVRNHGLPHRLVRDDITDVQLTQWVVLRRRCGRPVRFTPRELAVSPSQLTIAIRRYWREDQLRHELGTPASLRPASWGHPR